MKNVLLASSLVGSLLAGSAASAADLPAKAPPPPVAVVAASWTGCYIGGGGGYGFLNQDRDTTSDFATAAFAGGSPSGAFAIAIAGATPGAALFSETSGGRGWFGTVQGGCDYQFTNNLVIGVFGDGDWANIHGDHNLFSIARGEHKLSSSWAVGGRLGWLVTPTLLVFVSGGYTQAKFDAVDYTNNADSIAFAMASAGGPSFAVAASGASGLQLASHTYDGFFIGSGAEYAIGWWPGLFWKTEYRYADYRSATLPINCVSPVCGTPTSIGFSERIRNRVQTVRTELVWRFGR